MNTTIKCLCLITISLVSNLVYAQKKLYIPKDLQGMNLKADTSKWSLNRSIETDDLIFMWERGFDAEPQDGIVSGPDLDGKPMRFNLTKLRDRVQEFYRFFRDTLAFVQTTPDPSRSSSARLLPRGRKNSGGDTGFSGRMLGNSGSRYYNRKFKSRRTD